MATRLRTDSEDNEMVGSFCLLIIIIMEERLQTSNEGFKKDSRIYLCLKREQKRIKNQTNGSSSKPRSQRSH